MLISPLPSTVAWDPLRRFLAAHQVPGREWVEPVDGAHVRVVDTPAGPALIRVAWPVDAGAPPTVTVHGRDDADPSPEVFSQVAGVVWRWLGLDLDPGPAVAAFAGDPLLGPLVAARPGLRIPGSVDGAETALFTVLGQQVSLAAARTFAGRLVAQWSTAVEAPLDGVRVAGPLDLPRIAAAPAEQFRASLGVTGSRGRTLQTLAGALADGLTLAPGGGGDERASTRRDLLALPGIGPWTVEYLTLRCLRDPDGFPAGDLVLRRALAADGAVPAERAVRVQAEAWRPWRGFALLHLWTVAVFL